MHFTSVVVMMLMMTILAMASNRAYMGLTKKYGRDIFSCAMRDAMHKPV